MNTVLEDQSAHAHPDGCPSWCAAKGQHTDHRSRTAAMQHGPYGDSVTRVQVHQFTEQFFTGPAVSIEVWPGGFDPIPNPDEDKSDCHLVYSVGEAAALSDLLVDVVAGAVGRQMSTREATARLNDARALLGKFVGARRIRPDDAKKYSEDDQVHAVVPMALVSQLCSVLAPGVYPYFDPYDGDDQRDESTPDGGQ